MMKAGLITAVLFLFLFSPSYSAEKLVAYPVPLDPSHQTMRLMYKPSRGSGSVKVEIFDQNGDRVISRDCSSISDFVWKGYDNEGRRVGNGLYIVKVRWEDNSTGEVHTDVVRITVIERTK